MSESFFLVICLIAMVFGGIACVALPIPFWVGILVCCVPIVCIPLLKKCK